MAANDKPSHYRTETIENPSWLLDKHGTIKPAKKTGNKEPFFGIIVKIDRRSLIFRGSYKRQDMMLHTEIDIMLTGETGHHISFRSKIIKYRVQSHSDIVHISVTIPKTVIIFDDRGSKRLPLHCETTVRFISIDRKYLPEKYRQLRKGKIIDISVGGTKLQTDYMIRVGLRLNLQFALENYDIDVSGDVTWIEKVYDNYYCGVKFINLDPYTKRILEMFSTYDQ